MRSHQRRRLIGAIARACATSGFADTSIGEITTSASVSRKTFYEFFESKEQCLLVAHEEFAARLFEIIDAACANELEWPQKVRSAIHQSLAFLASDLAAAQLLTIAVLSTGKQGAERYDAMIDSLTARLLDGAPAPFARDNPYAEWAAIVFFSAMVDRAARRGDRSAILALEDDFAAMLLPANGGPP